MGSRRHIPAYILLNNLIELDVRMPAICLFRVNTHRTFEGRRFNSMADALEHITTLQKVCRHYILWIANAIRLSIESGYHSCWNWGAPIGISKTEFLHRTSRTFFYGGYSELAVHMSNRAEQSEMDFACARLVSPHSSHLIFTNYDNDRDCDSRSYLATWPLPEDQHLDVTEREPANQIIRLTLGAEGIDNIDEHLKILPKP
ncbi:hypothetical protein FB451DRAFT_50613 [Mycena latifolia]|nr:hypothetical protein FB451DRAFT_50613 [Mycena latifolia]